MKFYTTEIIDRIIDKIEAGLDTNEIYYRNVTGYRKPNMWFCPTQEELLEYSKCKNDPVYFVEKYCIVQTGDGPMNVKLRPYQKTIINNYFTHRFNINAVSRQIGMTTVISAIILHEGIFNVNKASLLISNKLADAVEKMEKIQEMYRRLPFFLKPGVVSYSRTTLYFDNRSSLRMFSGKNVAIGYSVDSLFLDDFAHITPSCVKNIHNLLIPVVANQESRIFISSTPNGYNEFSRLFFDAERKEGDPHKNMYSPCRVYWWEVPGRDEIWKEKEIECLGSKRLFDQEYDLQFFSLNAE